MKNNNEAGFSLVELLLVVLIIGIIAAIAIPSLQKGLVAAENRSAFSLMRTMSSSQMGFFTQNNRFARLDELNSHHGNTLGTMGVNQLFRNKFTFEMSPPNPTDAELRDQFTISGVRDVGGVTYRYEITQTGQVRRISPGPDPEEN